MKLTITEIKPKIHRIRRSGSWAGGIPLIIMGGVLLTICIHGFLYGAEPIEAGDFGFTLFAVVLLAFGLIVLAWRIELTCDLRTRDYTYFAGVPLVKRLQFLRSGPMDEHIAGIALAERVRTVEANRRQVTYHVRLIWHGQAADSRAGGSVLGTFTMENGKLTHVGPVLLGQYSNRDAARTSWEQIGKLLNLPLIEETPEGIKERASETTDVTL